MIETSLLTGLFWFWTAMWVNLPWLMAFGNGHKYRWRILALQLIPGFGWVIGLVWSVCGAGHIMRKTNWLCVRLWTYFLFFVCEVAAILLFSYGMDKKLPDFVNESVQSATSVYYGVSPAPTPVPNKANIADLH